MQWPPSAPSSEAILPAANAASTSSAVSASWNRPGRRRSSGAPGRSARGPRSPRRRPPGSPGRRPTRTGRRPRPRPGAECRCACPPAAGQVRRRPGRAENFSRIPGQVVVPVDQREAAEHRAGQREGEGGAVGSYHGPQGNPGRPGLRPLRRLSRTPRAPPSRGTAAMVAAASASLTKPENDRAERHQRGRGEERQVVAGQVARARPGRGEHRAEQRDARRAARPAGRCSAGWRRARSPPRRSWPCWRPATATSRTRTSSR